jgi:hypothetical protein
MDLMDILLEALPELTSEDFGVAKGTIVVQDDSDGLGAYIAKWQYSKPLPAGLKLGK